MPNSSLQKTFASGKFAITAEAGPLKGTSIEEIKEVAEALKGKVTAVNVTDQQSSVMRLGSQLGCLPSETGSIPVRGASAM